MILFMEQAKTIGTGHRSVLLTRVGAQEGVDYKGAAGGNLEGIELSRIMIGA